MCCMCQIVPERVLKRLAADRKYSAEQRKNFADTIKIDTQLRRLRTQAARLTRVAGLMAEAPTVAPAPAVTVYDCQSWSNPARGSNSQSGDVNGSNRKARFFGNEIG